MRNVKLLIFFLMQCYSIGKAQTIDDYITSAFRNIKNEKYASALHCSNNVLAKDSINPSGFLLRGISNTGLLKYGEAESDFNQAIKYDARSDKMFTASVYFSLGNLFVEQNKPAEAMANYDTAIKLNAGNAEYWSQRGLLFNKLKKPSDALHDLSKAIELNDNSSTYYNYRGYIKFEMGDAKGALSDLNKAIEIEPNNASACDSRGDVRRKNNDNIAALADYSKAVSLDPKNEIYRFHRGRLLMEMGEYEKAMVDLNIAVSQKNDFYEAIMCRAEAKIKKGDNSSAITDIDLCMKNDYEVAKAQYLFEKMNSISYFLNNYVEVKMMAWQTKGEYEKSADYIERMSAPNRNKKIEEFADEGFKEAKLREVNKLKRNSFEIVGYDPDNETYKLKHKDISEIVINVPIKNAPSFKTDYKNYNWSKVDFKIKEDRLFLSYLEISTYNSKYVYDITKQIGYDPKEFSLDFDAINIDLINRSVSQKKSEPDAVMKEQVRTFGSEQGMSDVDQNVPASSKKNPNAFGVVLGIENYKNVKSSVTYAESDAKSVREYFIKTLGIPEEQIYFRTNDNATSGEFSKVFEGWLQKRVDSLSEVYVYYAGHGAPSKEANAYLIPYDGDPDYAEQTGYSLNKLYEKLGQLKAKRAVVFIDACFSGQNREQKMLLADARSIGIKPKDAASNRKLTIFSASASDQVSSSWPEKRHGLFTYFLLKGLQGDADENKDGKITVEELGKFINVKVKKQAGFLDREQTPQIKSHEPGLELRR